jgi:pentatricopeptide repeat protein
MLRIGARPDPFTLPLLNRAAVSLPRFVGAVHCFGIRTGFCGNIYFCNTLLDVYARHGLVAPARQVFDEMPERDVVSWTTLVSAYAGAGEPREVSQLVTAMRTSGGCDCEPSAVTLSVVLRVCTALRDTAGGRQLHCYAVKSAWAGDLLVLNSMLTHYSRTASLEDAVMLFEQSRRRDIVSWNIIISVYSSEGNVSKVADTYERMREEEVYPNCETLTSVVATFTKHRFLLQGKKLHSFAVRSGLMDTILVASFVDFYAKCGELLSSVQLFEEFRGASSCLWSTMLWTFIHHGMFIDAIRLFEKLMDYFCVPSADMLRGLIICCTQIGALKFGKATHGYVIRNNYAAESKSCSLETSIVKLYAKCGCILLAERCFSRILYKDLVSWSSMIEAFAIHGHGKEALTMFNRMLEEGIKPNGVTFLSLLSACSHSGLVTEARELFDCMTKTFRLAPDIGHYTSMVDVLGRSGKLDEALQVISDMKVSPDGRIWGALLASCRVHSNSKLASFAAQKLVELEPDNVGYHVVFSNVYAGGGRWDEVEDIRSSMIGMNMEKSHAWSCVS